LDSKSSKDLLSIRFLRHNADFIPAHHHELHIAWPCFILFTQQKGSGTSRMAPEIMWVISLVSTNCLNSEDLANAWDIVLLIDESRLQREGQFKVWQFSSLVELTQVDYCVVDGRNGTGEFLVLLQNLDHHVLATAQFQVCVDRIANVDDRKRHLAQPLAEVHRDCWNMQRSKDGLEILAGFSYSELEVSRPEKSVLVVSSEEIVRIINSLCSDGSIIGFIVSGRSRYNLGSLLASCPNLGLAAEQGYFLRWSRGEELQSNAHATDFRLMQLTEPILSHYTKAMDGSYVETKETALVWHHQVVGMMKLLSGCSQLEFLRLALEFSTFDEPEFGHVWADRLRQ
jgi:hypothetical protein